MPIPEPPGRGTTGASFILMVWSSSCSPASIPNILLLPQADPASLSPSLCLVSPRETQPFTFLAKLCPQGTQAVHQPDGLIQFDFLTLIYSSFLESPFHWGLPERSRWCVHARVHVGLWAGGAASQPLVLPQPCRELCQPCASTRQGLQGSRHSQNEHLGMCI